MKRREAKIENNVSIAVGVDGKSPGTWAGTPAYPSEYLPGRLLRGGRFARLCLRDFSFNHLDDAGGRLSGERQPLRFDDELGQGLRLIAEARIAGDQVFDDAALA